jgi:hypothetical protein
MNWKKLGIFLLANFVDFLGFAIAITIVWHDASRSEADRDTVIHAIGSIVAAMAIGEMLRRSIDALTDREGKTDDQLGWIQNVLSVTFAGKHEGNSNMLKSLHGKWHSIYLYPYSENAEYVNEKVTIDIVESTVRITSKDNPKGDNYIGLAKLSGKDLIGEWVHEEGSSSGCFLLRIEPPNDLLIGIFVGDSSRSGMIHGEWVLAKDEHKLREGRALLVKSCGRFLHAKLGDSRIQQQ